MPTNNTAMQVRVSVVTKSETNLRDEHWSLRHKRRKHQRHITWMMLRHYYQRFDDQGQSLTVTVTRIAPRKLDSDNLASALKACRDGVADFLGIDDGDARMTWQYRQEKGRPKEYAVHVEIR